MALPKKRSLGRRRHLSGFRQPFRNERTIATGSQSSRLVPFCVKWLLFKRILGILDRTELVAFAARFLRSENEPATDGEPERKKAKENEEQKEKLLAKRPKPLTKVKPTKTVNPSESAFSIGPDQRFHFLRAESRIKPEGKTATKREAARQAS